MAGWGTYRLKIFGENAEPSLTFTTHPLYRITLREMQSRVPQNIEAILLTTNVFELNGQTGRANMANGLYRELKKRSTLESARKVRGPTSNFQGKKRGWHEGQCSMNPGISLRTLDTECLQPGYWHRY